MHADLSEWDARLRGLSDFGPPAGGWQAVLAACEARGERRDRRLPAALAAVVLAMTAGLAGWLQSAHHAMAGGGEAPLPTDATIASDMRAESDQLEFILAQLPERHAMRGSTAFTVAELEDRLALLDDRLSRVALEPNAPERSEQLWRERVGVLHSLVQVRYADVVGNY